MAKEDAVHLNQREKGLLPCGEPRVGGLKVTGDPAQVTCAGCAGKS